MKISGIILAAGFSSRMEGGNKLLLPYLSHTVIEETISQMKKSDVTETIIVTGYQNEKINKAIDSVNDITVTYNPDYALGRAESIKRGLEAIDRSADAALFMVADKPGVSYELINRAITSFGQSHPAILYVETPDGRGHPILFSKNMFEHLTDLEGDLIGDDLINHFINETETILDDQIQIDIDHLSDYQRLVESSKS